MLLRQQHADGHWSFELEADCTIPAEYILMMHFLGEIDLALQTRLAVYLREHQAAHGGWPLYQGGHFDISCSVKAYYALKLAGDRPDAPHMQRAREALLERGGAARANVFTRIMLAMFSQVPWRAVPYIPVEIMLLPRWFPFHLEKVSYWSRTVMVPLLVLCTLKVRALNRGQATGIEELSHRAAERAARLFSRTGAGQSSLHAPGSSGPAGRWSDVPARRAASLLARAEQWIIERLNGEDGLGGIFPAMVNAAQRPGAARLPARGSARVSVERALRKLLVQGGAQRLPPAVPLDPWDTALAALALRQR